MVGGETSFPRYANADTSGPLKVQPEKGKVSLQKIYWNDFTIILFQENCISLIPLFSPDIKHKTIEYVTYLKHEGNPLLFLSS